MDPFEPSGYIPIRYNERPPIGEIQIMTLAIFLVIYLMYLTCMLNCLRHARY